MGKQKAISGNQITSPTKNKTSKLIFLLIIIIYTFILYGNTLNNKYSLDDYIIKGENSLLVKKGIGAIGEIFTSTYTTKSSVLAGEGPEKSYGYRPLVRTVFAIEYSLFGLNPRISHLINVLIYLLMVLVLYQVLRRIFRDYSIWFPFVITLLFIAHPVHTEVVASLKNRDELLSMLFSLLTLQLLLKYYDKNKIVFLLIGLLTYILAFLSKPTALAFLLVFPLTMYFFTDMKPKKIWIMLAFLVLMAVIGGIMPFWFLERARSFSMVENPLYFVDSIWYIIGTGMYSLGYYFRLLLVPYPLLYYYGYDMIPIVNLANIWVILSIVFHLGIFLIALLKFKEKHVISFAILFYLVTIAMFSNIVMPVPGIIGERFLLIPSLGFVIVLAWLIFRLFKAKPQTNDNSGARIFFVMVLTALVLIPYSYKTINRNKGWYSDISLYRADMKFLDNSVKAHDLLGTTSMRRIELELSKQVNVAKFLMPDIKKALNHFQRAVEIWPGHASSWKNMAMIYNHPRIAEHLIAKGDTTMAVLYKRKAVSSFRKALEIEAEDAKTLFNLGLTYEYMGTFDSAAYFYQQCIDFSPDIINPRSRLADLNFMRGDEKEAIRLNMEIIRLDPQEALPYVSFGNYFMMKGDTLKAVESYEEAARRNTRPEVFSFLGQYFLEKGDMEKAKIYRDKYLEAVQPRQ
jgi:tetratricopeptide (TPR) repeat protein